MRTPDWPALTLLTGIAVLTGYLAGRGRPTPERTATEPAPPQLAGPDQVVAPDLVAAAADGRPVAGSPPDICHHRLRPDILLGPVLLVMVGIIVDRLRESEAGESVTAWFLIIGATAAAMLARWAGYRWLIRGYYCFLVGFSWAATALYVRAGLGALPAAWVISTLTASLLWLALELRGSTRGVERGHRLRPVLLALGHWGGFFVAWAVVAQLLYMFVSNTLADRPLTSVWDWLAMIGVVTLGLSAIAALTVIRPWSWSNRSVTSGAVVSVVRDSAGPAPSRRRS